jgi:hypothetical protein
VAVVVVGVDVEHMFEMSAVRDEEPVEALAAYGADEALGDRVRFRCSHRRLDDADAFAGEDGVEVRVNLLSRSRIRNLNRSVCSCSVQAN